MKRILRMITAVLCMLCLSAAAADTIRIQPAYEVPEYVTWLLEVADGEVGYREGEHGRSKYGEWAGDPYAQWCAEFLCWCVDQVDQRHGTELLGKVYPLYSGTNGGSTWFIKNGRYIMRNGNLPGWGYQWLKGQDHFVEPGEYIPQPGDWVFFTWTSDTDTDHVAMVEYCTKNEQGEVTIHVIEGNNPVRVQRSTYPLLYTRILGYGTVHDAADWTMRAGNQGWKVRQLQDKLVRLGLLESARADGLFGQGTSDALKVLQAQSGLKANGIATIKTQAALDRRIAQLDYEATDTWQVPGDEDDDDDELSDLSDLLTGFGTRPAAQDDDEELSLTLP